MTGEWPGRELSADDCAEIVSQAQLAGFLSCQVNMPLLIARACMRTRQQPRLCMLHESLMPLQTRPWGEAGGGEGEQYWLNATC